MSPKNLRIVIADTKYERRIYIEKNLNALGYFRIAEASSSLEALKLTLVPSCPVHLLIIEESLMWHDNPHRSIQSGSTPLQILKYRALQHSDLLMLTEGILPGLPDAATLSYIISARAQALDSKTNLADIILK
ncbi:hypothetical protein [Pseudomonas sp. Irchel s3a12]|uniref:hypothetical protein n=1 Tax=Pseudomonas sp. Irchel s3a12 TaxID=2009047 RepID=UPI0011401706|nr:hypothetical protein [Pseudomonas sp. Irchel s3a12]